MVVDAALYVRTYNGRNSRWHQWTYRRRLQGEVQRQSVSQPDDRYTRTLRDSQGPAATRSEERLYLEGAIRTSKEPSAAEKMIGDFAPKLVELSDRVLSGDVWERPELSKRDRSLATVAALIALHRPEQLRFHLGKALENGVKKEELIEVMTDLAFYAGWPNAMSVITVAKEVFSKP